MRLVVIRAVLIGIQGVSGQSGSFGIFPPGMPGAGVGTLRSQVAKVSQGLSLHLSGYRYGVPGALMGTAKDRGTSMV